MTSTRFLLALLVKLVHFCGHDEVVLVQTADFSRLELDPAIPPAERDLNAPEGRRNEFAAPSRALISAPAQDHRIQRSQKVDKCRAGIRVQGRDRVPAEIRGDNTALSHGCLGPSKSALAVLVVDGR